MISVTTDSYKYSLSPSFSMNISSSSISSIVFPKCKISQIDCSDNCIETCPEFPRSVKTVNLKRNKLSNIDNLVKCPLITKLLLSFNSITTIPQLSYKLVWLDVSQNNLDSLPDLSSYIHLRYFTACGNNIKILPNIPKNIYGLDVSDNLLTDVDLYLPSCKVCNLSNNQLKSVRLEGQLQQCDLQSNQIVEIEIISKHLEIVNISYNKLKELPDLPLSIKEISCTNNAIENIDNIEKYVNLQTLELSNNMLSMISGFTNIKYCNFSHNNIVSLPQLSCNYLDVSSNRLVEFPNITCRYLIANNNRIRTVHGRDDNIYKKIECKNNLIREIKGIFPNLREMYLDNNEIHWIDMNCFPKIEIITGNDKRSLYNDPENIHTSSLMNSLERSITNLLKGENGNIDEIADDIILTSETKKRLEEYCSDSSTFGKHQVTFKDILLKIWFIIANNMFLKEILNDEIEHSIDKCFVGRIGRLVNTLCGIDDRVIFSITEVEQCNNIAIAIFRNSSIIDKKEAFIREIKERGITIDISEWLECLT